MPCHRVAGGGDPVRVDELFPALVGDFGAHGFAGFEEGGAVEPRGQTVGMPGQAGRLVNDRAQDVLTHFLGELTVSGATQGDVIDEPEVSVRQLAESGFVAMRGESGEEVAVGFLHVLLPM